jgi:predicted RNA-binding protein with PIN domain
MPILIDGHNLIAQMPDIHLGDADDEEQLLAKLRQYRARKKQAVTVVFDPGSVYQPGSKYKQGGLTIQYAPHGRTADQIIINRLYLAANPKQILVVSSDRAIQRVAREVGARIMTAAEFATKLAAPAPAPTDEAVEDVALSPEEVEAWLKLFTKKNPGKRQS